MEKSKINIEKLRQEKSISELLEFSILNIDKPSGPTSFWVSDFVRERLGLRKTSHFGTLDPKVTGVLPIALNRACKLTGYFLGHDKEYAGIMHLHAEIEEKKLKEEIKKFIGNIMQLPPVKSRVKREERQRTVYSFDILEFDKEKKDVLFRTKVQAGTYIRKLCSDIGLKIGGAHMTELRRTKAGIFSETDSEFVNLYEFADAVEKYKQGDEEKLKKMLIPGEIISKILPVVQIKKDDEIINKLYNGSPVFYEFLKKQLKFNVGDKIAIFSGNKFVEVARVVNEKQILAKPEFVMGPTSKAL